MGCGTADSQPEGVVEIKQAMGEERNRQRARIIGYRVDLHDLLDPTVAPRHALGRDDAVIAGISGQGWIERLIEHQIQDGGMHMEPVPPDG